jgi:hypothetical protein
MKTVPAHAVDEQQTQSTVVTSASFFISPPWPQQQTFIEIGQSYRSTVWPMHERVEANNCQWLTASRLAGNACLGRTRKETPRLLA